MPALLHEHLRIRAHRGVEDRIEVHVHEILKITVIAARDGIHRLVGECHCVEESVERALHKLDERLLQRIFARAAEHGVLDNVCHTRIIDGRRAETDRKDLVVVRRLKEEEPRARLLVHKCIRTPFCLCDFLQANEAKAVYYVIYLHVCVPPSVIPAIIA